MARPKKGAPASGSASSSQSSSPFIETLTKELNQLQGVSSCMLSEPDRIASLVKDVCPVGIEPIDRWLLGIGGVARGRVIEVFGPEGAGKTSLQQQWFGNTTQHGGICLLWETEEALDRSRMDVFRIDPDRLILNSVSCVEDFRDSFTAALKKAKDRGAETIVAGLDTLAALPTRAELTAGLGKQEILALNTDPDGEEAAEIKRSKVAGEGVADKPRIMSRAFRIWGKLLTQTQVPLWINNQVRANIGGFGADFAPPSGNALKHHASVRLQFYSSGSHHVVNNEAVGKKVKVFAIKNKLAPERRYVELYLSFGSGYDLERCIEDHAKAQKAWPTQKQVTGEAASAGAARMSAAALAMARRNLGWDAADAPKEVQA